MLPTRLKARASDVDIECRTLHTGLLSTETVYVDAPTYEKKYITKNDRTADCVRPFDHTDHAPYIPIDQYRSIKGLYGIIW